ncbi:hypothetical protein [Hyalangium versicolor]|uniref:hypothetical protein n=1 Tax=Hyalangium versicolor TaxID=2861190 RepID=UPI001CC8F33F|nr:hypothetical protein [Hyalangium versicolor]
MKRFNIGGLGNINPFRGPKMDAPRPSTPTSPSVPTARPTPPRDGFQTPTTTSRGLFGPSASKPTGPQNVTDDFKQNPMGFATNNLLNVFNAEPPPGLPVGRPNAPFVPASQSIVSVNAHQRPGGNANLTFNPATTPGIPAHYLPYEPQGSGRFAGINGVPQRPGPNDPNMIVTGQLNGCAVHAFHDKNDQTLSFMHHANYSANGPNELEGFMQQNPNLRLAATLDPKDYAQWNGKIVSTYDPPRKEQTGATAFAHFDQRTQQWSLVAQMNDIKNGAGPDGRPELKRPDFNLAHQPTQFLQIPILPPPL